MTYLTVKGAADLLGVSPKTIRRAISNGKLPAFRVGTGSRAPIRLRQTDVEKLMTRIPTA